MLDTESERVDFSSTHSPHFLFERLHAFIDLAFEVNVHFHVQIRLFHLKILPITMRAQRRS